MSIGCIFLVLLFGLATILIKSADPTLASSGVRITRNFQGTRGATATKGANAPRTRAAAPCGDKTKRYADCGNGTVTDTATGLVWLKQSNCLPSANFEDAKKAVAGLKNGDCMLTDGSAPGDWRLPTQQEWETTMEKALALGCSGPTLTNDPGTGCITAGPSSFTTVEADYYWSGTTLEGQERAYFGDIDHGHVLNGAFTTTLRVWPVRGGQR